MKRLIPLVLLSLYIPALLCGCKHVDPTETITNRKIPVGDITDFYYTYENINFNAFYQRYRFYVEDGEPMFYHETRKRPNGYGWTTEEDITRHGNIRLTDSQWAKVIDLLRDGFVSERKDSDEAGDAGPWTYIYWKNDKGKFQQYDFANYEQQAAFEEYCEKLAGD